MILVGDIGGTNARLALAEPDAGEPIAERRFLCADYSGFEPLLADYLAQVAEPVTAGYLAVAGPVNDDGRRARLTNLPWTIDADALAVCFGLGRLVLANDFAAAAVGVTRAPADQLVCLQPGEFLDRAPMLVVGAGTGLGMAILLPENSGWRVVPGEGGHVAFGPTDELQADLWRDLQARHGRVTAERVVSGPGLVAIHDFLRRRAGLPELTAEPADIAAGAADPSGLARQAVDIFFSAYGAFAGDMALAVMARGGVYLAGGIAAQLLPLLPSSPFLPAFNAKAEHEAIAGKMPVHVVTDAKLGLRGAAALAMNMT